MARKIGLFLYYAMLARVPLLGLLALLLLAILGGSSIPTLTNMMLMEHPLQLGVSVFLACQLASLGGILTLVTWKLAPARFRADPLPLPAFLLGDTALRGLPLAVFALPLVVRLWWRNAFDRANSDLGAAGSTLAVLAGLAAAAAVLGLIEILRRFFLSRIAPRLMASRHNPLVRLTRFLGPGYYDEEKQRVEPGHALALTTAVVLGFVYGISYWVLHPLRAGHSLAPTLAYVLGLLMLFVSLLAGAAFLLDRYRIPLILGLVGYAALVGWLAPRDHYFQVRALETPPPPVTEAFAARQALQRELSTRPDSNRVLTVVAAAGGGIQAAGWTVHVLEGLQQAVGEDFPRSIYLMSSVSGGSAGLYFYLQSFEPERAAPKLEDLPGIFHAATSSSLEATAWGLAYPDVQRAFLPFLRHNPWLDRSWATERSWLLAAGFGHSRSYDGDGPWLSDWMSQAKQGWMPGVIFNGTTVEDGRQLRLSNLDLEPLADLAAQDASEAERAILRVTSARTLRDTEGRLLDLPAVSAARLSSTFPFVTPVARARRADRSLDGLDGLHFADGGYFDNYGVVSALEWLLELQQQGALDAFHKIVFIQINAFPKPPALEEGGHEAASRSWFFSAAAPLTTLTQVRTSTQVARNLVELGMLADIVGPKVVSLTFRPPARGRDEPEPPLSWYLSRSDKQRIADDWQSEANRQELGKLVEIFDGKAVREDPAAPGGS